MNQRSFTGAAARWTGALLAIAATLAPVAGASAASPIAAEHGEMSSALSEGAVFKSIGDPRRYRTLRLANGLQVLLVSDPSADRAAASMDVRVGYADDPDHRPGLAHLTEHMLFLGTRKYPQPGGFGRFIATHGGQENAFTTLHHTNYHFDVDTSHLEPALDRFAQLFVAPLLTPELVDREREVVHAEFRSKLTDDARRTRSALKRVLNPRHPMSRFSTGNAKTLADRHGQRVHDELVEFHARHYSPDRMALAVLGRQSLSLLQEWVERHFIDIPHRAPSSRPVLDPLFVDGALPARLTVAPVRDRRSLTLTFPIPSLVDNYRSKPEYYVASLLNYAGSQQLLARLKEQGLITALRVSADEHSLGEARFTISMALSERGLARTDEIIGLTLAYLRLIESKGIERWRYDELVRVTSTDFRFHRRSKPLSYVRTLAKNLHLYPSHDVVRAPHMMSGFSESEIRAVLARLVPENMLVTVVAKGLATDAHTPWYDTPYRIERLSARDIRRWSRAAQGMDLALPSSNQFLASDFSLKRRDEELPAEPVLVKSTRGLSAWFRQDDTFLTPRADFLFSVHSAHATTSPRTAVLTQLYVELVKATLAELDYPARAAGLTYMVYPDSQGFSVRISGFNQKQPLLLERVLDALRDPVINELRFALAKDRLERRLRSMNALKPYKRALREIDRLILTPYWPEGQLLASLATQNVDSLNEHIQRLFSRVEVQALAHGNLRAEESMSAFELLETRLMAAADRVLVPRRQAVRLGSGSNYLRRIEVNHQDSAVSVYYQGDRRDDAMLMRYALLARLMNKSFYDALRTQKQLGYVVYTRYLPIEETPGLVLVVQSPSASPAQLEQHIDGFLTTFAARLDAMSEGALDAEKQALLGRLLSRDRHITARSSRYWRELKRGYRAFDRQERLTASVRDIRRFDLIATFQEQLLGNRRSRLVVHAVGRDEHDDSMLPSSAGTLIDDPDVFKDELELFPPLDETRARGEQHVGSTG